MKKNKVFIKDKEKYTKISIIIYVVLLCLGMIGLITNFIPIGLIMCFIFSFIILMIMVCSMYAFKEGIFQRIIFFVYWFFMGIVVIGFIITILGIDLNNSKYKYEYINIKGADKFGYVVNTTIDVNNDAKNIKIVKPFLYKIPVDTIEYYIYKTNNVTTLYYLFDENIGLHTIFLGFYYMFIISFVLFFVIMINIFCTTAVASYKEQKKELLKEQKKSLKKKKKAKK